MSPEERGANSEGGQGMGGSLPLNSEFLLETDEENEVLSRVGRWDSAHMGGGLASEA